jgi:hypothetical protein
METGFRPLNVVEKTSRPRFSGQGRLETAAILGDRKANRENGSIELETAENERAEVQSASPTEGTCADIDGVPIAVLLHVKEGKLHRVAS